MLIQFDSETSGRATGDYQPGRSHVREGASRNPAIQLRAVSSTAVGPVASSRVEENDGAFYSSYGQPDAACRGRIAFGVFGFILGFMFLLPLILAGIAVKFG